MYRMRRVPGRRARQLIAAAVVGATELWLLFTPDVKMSDPAFELLCALSCWLPAWFCADLLSEPPVKTETRREWTVAEVGRRMLGRLAPTLFVLGLWCGTFTLRSLKAELLVTTPRFMANIDDPNALVPVWVAWTTVFLVNSIAYGAGAGICSALARRTRRWLVAPSVVVGASLALALAAWAVLSAAAGAFEGLPFMNGASPLDSARQILVAPNYVAGSTVALGTVQWLNQKHQDWLESWARNMPHGIAIYCWIGTLLFALIAMVCGVGILWIARNRERRHPNTAPEAGDRIEAATLQPV